MKIIQDLMTILEPEEGYILTDGETYSDKVFLAYNDSPSNWWEIPIEEVNIDERVPGEDSLPIIE